jgi:hypothetical protein
MDLEMVVPPDDCWTLENPMFQLVYGKFGVLDHDHGVMHPYLC